MSPIPDGDVADAVSGGAYAVPSSPARPDCAGPAEESGNGNGNRPVETGGRVSVRTLLLVVLGAILAQAAYHWLVNIVIDFSPNESVYDFSVYYAAALALRGNPHANIFDPNVLRAAASVHGAFLMPVATLYLYPPLLAILMIPLTTISFAASAHVWAITNLALWLISTGLLISLARYELSSSGSPLALRAGGLLTALRQRHLMRRLVERLMTMPDIPLLAGALVIFLSLTSGPLQEGVVIGQVTMFVFFLTVCAPWLERRGQARLCGALLALAALIKVFPLVLIGYYLLRGRWRVVIGAAVTFVVLIAGMVAVVGVQGVLATRSILTNGVSSGTQFQNEALSRLPFWLSVLVGHELHTAATAAGYALVALVAIAFVAGVLACTWRHQQPRDRSADARPLPGAGAHELVGYGWALCTMILVSPVTWEHHLAWVLPAFLFALWYVARELLGAPRQWRSRAVMTGLLLALALIVGYALISQDLPFGYDGRVVFDPSPYIFFHHILARPLFMIQRPLGVLLIWGVSGYLFLRGRPTADAALPAPPGTAESRIEAGHQT